MVWYLSRWSYQQQQKSQLNALHSSTRDKKNIPKVIFYIFNSIRNKGDHSDYTISSQLDKNVMEKMFIFLICHSIREEEY